MSTSGTALLIVDPQNDFHPGGSLAIPGADTDAERIASLITQHGGNIDEIFVTLDSHHKMDIAHPKFWKNSEGFAPSPFTLITTEDIIAGRWVPVQDQYLIGTIGHAVYPCINQALQNWAATQMKRVTYVHKGENALTEHYSCFRAEVLLEDDPSTGLNKTLLSDLRSFERVLVCGQALSHCVNFSVRDLVKAWDLSRMSNLVVINDASTSVPGHEDVGETFLKEMEDIGVTITTADKSF